MKKRKQNLSVEQEEFNKNIAEMVPNDAYHTKHECFLAGIQTGINLAKRHTTKEVTDIYDLCEAIAAESHTLH
jgi:hypothetical protein